MKQIVLLFLSFFALNVYAQYSVSGTKTFSLSKKEIKGNVINFELENTDDQPFVAFDIRINNKINEETKVYLQYDFEDNGLKKTYVNNEWKRDIHFDNETTNYG